MSIPVRDSEQGPRYHPPDHLRRFLNKSSKIVLRLLVARSCSQLACARTSGCLPVALAIITYSSASLFIAFLHRQHRTTSGIDNPPANIEVNRSGPGKHGCKTKVPWVGWLPGNSCPACWWVQPARKAPRCPEPKTISHPTQSATDKEVRPLPALRPTSLLQTKSASRRGHTARLPGPVRGLTLGHLSSKMASLT